LAGSRAANDWMMGSSRVTRPPRATTFRSAAAEAGSVLRTITETAFLGCVAAAPARPMSVLERGERRPAPAEASSDPRTVSTDHTAAALSDLPARGREAVDSQERAR